MKNVAALMMVLGLFACSPKTPDGQDEPGAPDAARAEHAPRLYDAISKTAEAFTGGLEVTDVDPIGPNATPSVKIITANGHVYEANFIEKGSASDKAGIVPWSSMMPVPEDADVTLYSVEQELVNAKTPNGGICAPEKTGFLALASYKEEEDSPDMMQIAAFSDTQWPPSKAPKLCGTFTYAVHAAAPAK